LIGNDIDTDRIIPARFLKCINFDALGKSVFEDDRKTLKGRHPFDLEENKNAKILIVNSNFGCGSSREHAPQALMRWGIKAIIGESFNKLGFPNGLDLGLAMATMGLLSSSILGSIFIFLGRTLGLSDTEEILEQKDNLKEKNKTGIFADLRIFIINLGFSGMAISFGVLLLKFLRYISSSFGDFSKEIIFSLPVFPFILIGSLLIRYILEKTKNTEFISNILQREIGILSTDLLIFTAMASLDIAVVFDNWILILVFTIFGLFWNLICIAYFAYFIFDDYWFEKSLIEFGNSTGVVASGLLLLRLADPKNISKTLPIFTSKQLFAQLILSGGLFTVLAPLMISKIGLDYWTEICAVITFAILFIALIFNKVEMKKFQ